MKRNDQNVLKCCFQKVIRTRNCSVCVLLCGVLVLTRKTGRKARNLLAATPAAIMDVFLSTSGEKMQNYFFSLCVACTELVQTKPSSTHSCFVIRYLLRRRIWLSCLFGEMVKKTNNVENASRAQLSAGLNSTHR
jgi:hypothetical protein